MPGIRHYLRKLSIPGSMVLLGIGLMVYGNHLGRQAEESVFWPYTMGEVLVSQVTKHVFTESKRSSNNRSSPRTTVSYEPEIRYEYRVFGERHEGHGIHLITPFRGTPEEAARELEPYPVGTRVRVFYDPDDPGTAVLERGADELESYLLYYMGLLWTIIWGGVLAVAMTVQYVKARRAAAKRA